MCKDVLKVNTLQTNTLNETFKNLIHEVQKEFVQNSLQGIARKYETEYQRDWWLSETPFWSMFRD